jgi:hypothetical protein
MNELPELPEPPLLMTDIVPPDAPSITLIVKPEPPLTCTLFCFYSFNFSIPILTP